MNFKDRWVTDESGEEVLFTVELQRKLFEAGLPVEYDSLDELDKPVSTPKPKSSSSAPKKKKDDDLDFASPPTVQIDPKTGKYIGRMKWYNVRKGYGFIVRGGGEEIFFHKTGTLGDPAELKEGQWVLYDVEETHKGPEATDVESYKGDTDDLLA